MTGEASRLAPGFRQALGRSSLATLESSANVIYGLWPDLTLAYVNPAWFRFARDNHGEPAISRDWPLGRCVMDAVPPPLQVFYRDYFGSFLAPVASTFLSPQEYECSSAENFRLHLMSVYPLAEQAGLLVSNALAVGRTHARPAHPPYADDYHDPGGWIRQCSHCRCVQHAGQADRWDWVPYWVASPPASITHALCPLCLDHFYPL